MSNRLLPLLLAAGLSANAFAQTYSIVDLDPTQQFNMLIMVRFCADGNLVGGHFPGGHAQAATIDGTGTHVLAMFPGDLESYAADRNANGDVFGSDMVGPGSAPLGYTFRPIVWPGGGAPVDLNTLVTGGAPLTLRTVNASDTAGNLVGAATTPGGDVHAYYFSQGIVTDLGTPFGMGGWSYANERDVLGGIVGYGAATANGIPHALFWPSVGAAPVDLNNPATMLGSYAYDVNRFGQVCGEASFLGTVAQTGALWTNGVASNLGGLTHGPTRADGINDVGTIVGTTSGDWNLWRALVWKNGVMSKLDDLVTLPTGTHIAQAFDVNNAGEILAIEENGISSTYRMVRLVPQCAGTFASFGTGCAGTNGVPTLTGVNCPTPGNTFALEVGSARPNAFSVLFAGLGVGTAQVVPSCALQILPLVNAMVALNLDAAGAAFLPIAVPAGTPVVDLNLQLLIADPAGSGGVAATRPLKLHVQ